MKTVSIRIEEDQNEELEKFAKKNNIDKSTAGRKVISEGLKVIKRKEALEKIRLRQWTLWKAAEYCGESFRSMLHLLREENIPFPLSVGSFKNEMDELDKELIKEETDNT